MQKILFLTQHFYCHCHAAKNDLIKKLKSVREANGLVLKLIHQTNSLLAYNKHLNLKKLGGTVERCGTEDIRVKCDAANSFQIVVW